MKRLITILFLLGFLYSTTELHQLLKISSLIEHYVEHKKNNPALTLLEFFTIHYAIANVVDDDYEKDQKLPFKSCNHQTNTVDLTTSVFSLKYTLNSIENYGIQRNFLNKESMFKGSLFLSSIWQPPKFC